MNLDAAGSLEFKVDFSVYVVLWISKRRGNLRLIRMDMPSRIMLKDHRDDHVFPGDHDVGVGNGRDTNRVS